MVIVEMGLVLRSAHVSLERLQQVQMRNYVPSLCWWGTRAETEEIKGAAEKSTSSLANARIVPPHPIRPDEGGTSQKALWMGLGVYRLRLLLTAEHV